MSRFVVEHDLKHDATSISIPRRNLREASLDCWQLETWNIISQRCWTVAFNRLTIEFPTVLWFSWIYLLYYLNAEKSSHLSGSWWSLSLWCDLMRRVVSDAMFSSTLIATYGNCNQPSDIARAPFSDTRPLLYANPSPDWFHNQFDHAKMFDFYIAWRTGVTSTYKHPL